MGALTTGREGGGRRAGLKGLVAELRRRHVFKVAVAYAIVAWIIMQIGEVAFSPLGLPEWALTLVIVLSILFFPFAMILAWAFDLTPHGVVRTAPLEERHEPGASAPTRPGEDVARAAAPFSVAEAVAPGVQARSIVVLPFRNMSAQPENEYLSDGFSEDLIIRLSKAGALRVISRTSAWQYKDGTRGARQIGQELGVAYILTGSVRRSGERLRIAAQLVDARDDDHLWAETYDRDVVDLFDIQADVATSIISAVDDRISPRGGPRPEWSRSGSTTTALEATRGPTTDMECYDAYLKGRHHWNGRTAGDLDRSIEALSAAARCDPTFMLAHAGLADSYITLAIYGQRAPAEVMPLARSAANRALALAGEAAEGLTARACVSAVYEWDWRRAEAEFERAVSASPPYVTARMWYAMHHLLPLRRFEEARRHLDAALMLDPLSAPVRVSRAALTYYEGDYADAAADFRGAVQAHPEFALAHMLLGLSLLAAGAPEDALAPLERARTLSGASVETTVGLGRGLVAIGRTAEARALLAELSARAEREYVSAARVAQLEAALGDEEAALRSLQRAVDARASDLVWLDVTSAFDQVRDAPRYRALRDRVLP